MRLIDWSPRAVDDYEQNIAYLIQEWQQREVNHFIRKVTQTIANIQLMPEMYPVLEGANAVTRKAVVANEEELSLNSRARSAKLRIGERL